MTKAIRKLFSVLLVAVMLLSLVAPALPVMATDSVATGEEVSSDLRVGVLSDIPASLTACSPADLKKHCAFLNPKVLKL